MTEDNIDTNVAVILHDIAANSDKVTGKILRKADKAAKKGKSFIKIRVSYEDYDWVNSVEQKKRGYRVDFPAITPLIEKLLSLGFKFSHADSVNGFFVAHKYYVRLEW